MQGSRQLAGFPDDWAAMQRQHTIVVNHKMQRGYADCSGEGAISMQNSFFSSSPKKSCSWCFLPEVATAGSPR
jgi:hypothetical protein